MDAVVTWLDTSEKSYINQRNKDFGEKKPYDLYRVGRRDELRFCLRGLYYNMPWLRKIYLVTWDNQFPDWLDKTTAENLSPPIIKIKRETLNENKPLYGSYAVEACIHEIPGISDIFIYCNCDMFVTKKMKMSDWIENGVGKLRHAGYIKSLEPKKDMWSNYYVVSQVGLFIEKFGRPKFKFFNPSHQISLLSKKACLDTKNAFPDLYNVTVNLMGREKKEHLTRFLYEYVAVHKGYCVLDNTPIGGEYMDYESDYKHYKLKKNCALLCTNLNSYFKESSYGDYLRFMINLFPTPLPGEKYMSYENVCYYVYSGVKATPFCKGKPISEGDNVCLIPVEKSYDVFGRLPYVRRTIKRHLNQCPRRTRSSKRALR